MQTTYLIRAGSIVAAAIFLIAMLGPFQAVEDRLPVNDKVGHILAFAVIMVALLLNLPRVGRAWLAAGALLVGVAVEGVQDVTGRGAEAGDVLADLAGVAIVAVLWIRRPWL